MLFVNKIISNKIGRDCLFEPSKAKEGARVQGVQDFLQKNAVPKGSKKSAKKGL